MYVKEIWRYPVKSMAGEPLDVAHLSAVGLAGDRLVQVYDGQGRVVTARSHPGLLGRRATLDPRGEPLVDGRSWIDPTVLAEVRQIAGPQARLMRNESSERFDVLPLLVATDGAIAAFGRDGRRLRPNIVIGGVSGLDERRWPGGQLRIGEVVIAIDSLRGRCVMTTFDPDTQAHDPDVLRDIVKRFGGRLALNCDVERGGVIRVGQEVDLHK
ncbi:MAG: MOSC N-terminal beta barrel domain-containing protein [Candidatus Solibacter usitatus]|nr:MOSC N-terminal beta barrel domain-containing protein [Candidatus Solibacter usitatus]